MNIKVLKLLTGEEIVGEVVGGDLNSDSFSLKNCVALMLQPTRDGKLSFGFIPYGSMVDGGITISKSNVLYSGDPTQDLKDNYSATFSAIVTPPKSLITG
jgi:hypothetical protein